MMACAWTTNLARQPGAAQITLACEAYALPEDIEHARELLDAYLANRQHPQEPG
jgi:hypothetical protein